MSLPAQRDACDVARAGVLKFLLPHGIDGDVLYRLELILEETLMNVVWHAFKDQDEHAVGLAVDVDDSRIVMQFQDDGVAFDPTLASPPTMPTSIEKAMPGGLGLMLVRKFAESVVYQRVGGRNLLTIAVAR